MASTTETGHAKNVANFETLLTTIKAFDNIYNPSKNALKINQLEALLSSAKNSLKVVIDKNTIYNTKINERQTVFSGLKSLSTRLINALQATEASLRLIEDAKGFNRKIQGKRSKAIPTASKDPEIPMPRIVSTSQQSFIQIIEHFTGFLAVLKTEPSYTPNEEDLKIESLEILIANLKVKNNEVVAANVALTNARIARNNILYGKENSLHAIAAEIKKYIKAIFGATSPEFAQVKGIQVKTIKI